MWRLVLAILLWAGVAQGQTVTVRSGAHADFSRLVLTFPEPTGWDFGRTADGYGLRSRQRGQRFDISTVFERIDRQRLAALWVDPESGVLRLGLACDCHAIAEPFRPGIVVIDIRDGPPPVGSPQELALENAGAWLPRMAQRGLLRPRVRPADLVVPPPFTPLPWVATPAAQPSLAPPLPIVPPDPRALILQAELARSLAAAISAGTIAPASGPRPTTARESGLGPRIIPLAAPPDTSPPAQLRIREVFDHPTETAATQATCVAPERLDMAAWATDAPAIVQMAEARSGMIGEFDRPEPERLLATVRVHLHFGFGREARNLLALWLPDHPERPLLDALGTLIDAEPTGAVFLGQQGCDGAAALWSVLAWPQPGIPTGSNAAAVVGSFSALPPHLRGHLGRELAERFLAAGDPQTARSIRDAIDRAPGDAGDSVAMIDAGLDLAENRPEVAEPRLEGLLRDNSGLAPIAVATLVESTIRRGDAPAPETLTALSAMLQEQRTDTEAPRLRHALALGLTLTPEHNRAFRDLAGQDPQTVPAIWALLAERGSDIALAELALDPPDGHPDLLGTQPRMAIARRLAALGFAAAAQHWLTPVATEEADLLRARLALHERDGRSALRLVAAMEGPAPQRLRAEAMAQIGDLSGAHAAWLAAGDATQASRQLFLARDWQGAAGLDDPGARHLLTRHQIQASPGPVEGPLDRGRQLLAEARDTRATVAEALALLPPP